MMKMATEANQESPEKVENMKMSEANRNEPRPKLSDRAARCWSYYDGDQGAAQALDEAWAILAEAEREVGSVYCPVTNHADLATIRGIANKAARQRAYAPSTNVAWLIQKSLAESLAAFCEGSL